jgi:3-phosphoshikimate 1-carboxyvinyltransferase
VPGDKSVTHRALLLGAVAEGETVVRGALDAGDTRSTARCVQALGATVAWDPAAGAVGAEPAGTQGGPPSTADLATAGDGAGDGAIGPGTLRIRGVDELASPAAAMDCGNAGTAARLLCGLLASRDGRWTLDGDDSLRGRPMGRVADPLRSLGASLDGDRLPLTVHGTSLHGGELRVDVPSAQVKSALLLAGLAATGPLTVEQPTPTRDHTERMLPAFGVPCVVEGTRVTVHPARPRAATVDVPGDPSAAAFLVVAALLSPGSALTLHGVGLWPRRTGWIDVLHRAGAAITATTRQDAGPDPVGDLAVEATELGALQVAPYEVPDLVDELPILALAAARARGISRFEGLAELRHKESDRVAAIARLLGGLGVPVVVEGDTLSITGVDGFRAPPGAEPVDHRLALTAAVARHVGGFGPFPVDRCAEISWPGFDGAFATLLG